MESSLNMNIDFTSLLWDDVLFPSIFPFLTIKDLFMLRGTSQAFKNLVECYFSQMKKCDLIMYHNTFTPTAFSVLIEHCNQLRILFIRNSGWLTNKMLTDILLKNKFLTHIDLSFCCNITSKALQPAIIRQKDLIYLKLENCFWLTSGCLEALALHHSKLEVISLTNCAIADVQSIGILLQRSKNLRELSLSGVQCVSDSIMEIIAHCNRKLKLLNVNRCPQVTGYGAMMVAEYCRELDYFFLAGCTIEHSTVNHLRKKIRYFYYDSLNVGRLDPLSYTLHIPV